LRGDPSPLSEEIEVVSMTESGTESGVALRIPVMQALYAKVAWLSWPLVRITAGALLMPHGAQKLFGAWGGSIANTAAGFARDGLEPALPLAYLAGGTEFFGGFLIAIGFLTRPAAFAAAILLGIATIVVHVPIGYFWNARGCEYPLMWTLLQIAILARGAGPLSVDRALGREF
jgi:putative oxidoreductase